MVRSRASAVLVAIVVITAGGVGGGFEARAAAAGTLSNQSQPPDIEDALDRVPPGTSPRDAARILFPDDMAAQAEYVRLALAVDGLRPGGGAQEFPVLAVFVPVLAKCVASGIGGAAIAEGVNLVRNGEPLAVEGMVDAAIGGCIAGVLPRPLMALAQSAKKPLVTVITAVIVRFSSLEG